MCSAGAQPERIGVPVTSGKRDGLGGGRAERRWNRRRAEIALRIAGRGSDVPSHRGGSRRGMCPGQWRGQKRLPNGNRRRWRAQDRAPAAPLLVRGRLHQGARPRQPRRCAGFDRVSRSPLRLHLRISRAPPPAYQVLVRRRRPLRRRPPEESAAGPMRERGATTRDHQESVTWKAASIRRSSLGLAGS